MGNIANLFLSAIPIDTNLIAGTIHIVPVLVICHFSLDPSFLPFYNQTASIGDDALHTTLNLIPFKELFHV